MPSARRALRPVLFIFALLGLFAGAARAQDENQETVDSLLDRSALLLIRKDTALAEKLLTIAVGRAGSEPDAQAACVVERGWKVYRQNHSELVGPDLARALAIDATSAEARALRNQLLIDAGKYDAVLAGVRDVLPTPRATSHDYALYGLALLLRGKPEDRAAAQEAIATGWGGQYSSEHYDLLMAEGERLFLQDKLEDAARLIGTAGQLAADRPEPKARLAAIAAVREHVLAARASSAVTVGAEALARKDFPAAEAECEAALAANGQDESVSNRLSVVHYAWAEALIQNHEFNLSRQHSFRAYTCSRLPDREATWQAFETRITASALQVMKEAYAQKRFTTVLDIAEGELKNNPADDNARQQQIGVLRQRERWPEAIRAYADGIKHPPADEGAGLTLMLHRAGRDNTIDEYRAALQKREDAGENVSAERAAFIAAVAYAADLEPAPRLKERLAVLYAEAQQWRAARAAFDDAIRDSSGEDQARYQRERAQVDNLQDFARYAGKHYALARKLGQPFSDYLSSIFRDARTPVNPALESQLPPAQKSQLGRIREMAARRLALQVKFDAALAEANGIKARHPDGYTELSTKSDYDNAVARAKSLKEEINFALGNLDGWTRDFWQD